MAQLNSNIPYQQAYVRDLYLYGMDKRRRGLTTCYIFGVKSILNRPLGFHCQLENGAVFWGLPLSAYAWKKDYQEISDNENKRLSELQWWDCQSNDIAVTVFSYLEGYMVDCISRSKMWRRGKYLFSIDDYYSDLNALPLGYANDQDSKVFHVIKLDNGNFCAYPNNFLRWHNPNFTTPYDKASPPKYRAYNVDIRAEHIE